MGRALILATTRVANGIAVETICMESHERKQPFKHVTRQNWLDSDPVSASFVKLDHRDGSITPMDGADWIDAVALATLSDAVPNDIVNAFEFTKGGLGYGFFYYPLATIVGQQILRVADFAVDRFFRARAIVPHPRSMAQRLKRLHEDGLVDDMHFQQWDAIRRLRNSATHPDFQHVWLPSDAIRTLKLVADLVSALPWPIDPAAGEDGLAEAAAEQVLGNSDPTPTDVAD